VHRYLQVAHVKPGDPVEEWLTRLKGEEAVRLRAGLETLTQLDPKADKDLAIAIKADLAGLLSWARLPGATTSPGVAGAPPVQSAG